MRGFLSWPMNPESVKVSFKYFSLFHFPSGSSVLPLQYTAWSYSQRNFCDPNSTLNIILNFLEETSTYLLTVKRTVLVGMLREGGGISTVQSMGTVWKENDWRTLLKKLRHSYLFIQERNHQSECFPKLVMQQNILGPFSLRFMSLLQNYWVRISGRWDLAM